MKSLHEEISDLLPDQEEDRFSSAQEIRKKAMDLLARREHGREELAKKLANKGFVRTIVDDQLARLADEGLLSDTRFAESFVQSRINQGKGPARIRADLGQRGIPDGVIEGVLEAAGADWYALAKDERVKKFGRAVPANYKEKARQMRFLQYRGFESDHIRAAIDADAG
ncbi:MAG: recombination regulator RecX [Gammaproteobacteria bacterium]|nr:recombination regulator RecX [Gammaproteobacteria bacterium]NNF48371.1 regulatory protein RecX [Woeseiaceae bacterium]MBT8093596.1 recombination regulator RecX [Gammaproteobacteria bacterium]MBT8104293.1 recombination regulator RecX [Gammaproteobacteria bacterium]NNK24308.1 regulatory protein RecX [Woeseiaceae bacterium]